jgi:hypothetical protein
LTEIYSLFRKLLALQLKEDGLDDLSLLLIPATLAGLKSKLTSHDLDRFGLLGEVDITGLPIEEEKDVLSALNVKRAAQLTLWLDKWRQVSFMLSPNYNQVTL